MKTLWGSAAVIGALLLTGCGTNQNAQPCKDFEKSYNAMAGTLHDLQASGQKDPDTMRAMMTNMRDTAAQASKDGSGDVAIAMRDVAANETAFLTTGSNDAGTAAIYGATTSVANACKAAGTELNLTK